MAKKSVVKIGMMSFAHMHAFSYASCVKQIPFAELVGIADDDADRAKQMAGTFGVKAFSSYSEMLDSDIDGVIVCSENMNHRKHVVQAAQNGKHVMCEKPIAGTKEDAEAIIEVCKRSDVKLQTAFPCRFHPAFARLKRAVESGELGKLIAVKGTNQGKCPFGWFVDKKLSGGGAAIDHTVHVADLLRAMTGAEPVRVYAEIDNRMHKQNFDDTGILTIDFSNGMFATIDCSWSRPKSYAIWGNVNLSVTGTNGVAKMEMLAQKIDFFSDKAGKLVYECWGDNIDLGLVTSFCRAIAEDTPPEITGEDGLKALEVALAAYKSAETGKPVSLED